MQSSLLPLRNRVYTEAFSSVLIYDSVLIYETRLIASLLDDFAPVVPFPFLA